MGVADELACKGFIVTSLLDFYSKQLEDGKLNKSTKTFEVVRDIVIPETREQQCCYADLMGPRKAKKLMSHW